MGFLKLLLNSGLLFLSAVTLTINENSGSNHGLTDEDRLSHNITPLNYEINMTLFDTDLIVIEGQCKIKLQIHHPTQSIRFHADPSQLYELIRFNKLTSLSAIQYFLRDRPVLDKELIVYKAKNVHYKNNNIFELFYEPAIPSGFYVLQLVFRNVEDRNKGSSFGTFYINEVGNRTWFIVTDFQAIGIRKLFPCWNEPAFRANFKISIKHHNNYNVLSNMPKKEILKTEQPNMTLTVFEGTPSMPTYHVSAILIMNFKSTYDFAEVHIEGRIQLDFPRYITFAYNVINKVTKYLKSQEKCFEKFTQVKHVAIPGFLHDAVANLGLIYFRETAIIYDKEKDSVTRGTEIARLIGRTVAYQCFDNTIPSWWSYMWLNEGIAMLLGMDAVDEAYPTFRMKDYFVVQIQQESLRFDTDSIMKPLISEVNDLSDIDSVFSISYYIKAPVIMRMLQQILTNNVFRKGINMYLKKKVSSLETTPDVFWGAMQTAYNEIHEYNEKPLNVKQMMNVWTKQQHYPVVKVIHNDTFVIAFVESTVSTEEKNWLIPYTIVTQMDPDFFLSNRSQPLKMQNSFEGQVFSSYDIGKDKWIIVNVQQIGYYRVNYDALGWENIVRYLYSDEYDKIHVLNRAQIIDDAFYFLMEGHLSLTIFVELAKYLLQEKDYIAWYPMFKAFEYMSSSFPFLQSTYIKTIMIKILDVLLKEIGYEKKSVSSSINSLTEEAAKWACTFGSSKCKEAALAKLLIDLQKENFSHWMKEWTLCNGLMIQDHNSFWDYVLNIYKEKFDYTILKFLACTECFFKIRNNIELIALNEKTKDDDRIHIFHSIVARHAKNDTTLDYILANFDRVKPRNISIIVALVDIINHVYSKEQLNKITEFLENYQRIRITGLLKHPLIDNKLLKKMMEVVMNNTHNLLFLEIISLFKKKTNMRLSQIMRQMSHFHNLYV